MEVDIFHNTIIIRKAFVFNTVVKVSLLEMNIMLPKKVIVAIYCDSDPPSHFRFFNYFHPKPEGEFRR